MKKNVVMTENDLKIITDARVILEIYYDYYIQQSKMIGYQPPTSVMTFSSDVRKSLFDLELRLLNEFKKVNENAQKTTS